MQVLRGTIQSYDPTPHRATVQITGSTARFHPDIPVAAHVPAYEATPGRECAVLTFDEINPDNTMVIGVFGPPTAAGARVFHNAAQTIPSGVVTTLSFNSERRDDAGFHSTAQNNSRLTVPPGYAGWYQVGAAVVFEPNATGFRQARIVLNGATDLAIWNEPVSLANAASTLLPSTCRYLDEGDYVEVRVFQNCGSDLQVRSAGAYTPEFWLVRAG